MKNSTVTKPANGHQKLLTPSERAKAQRNKDEIRKEASRYLFPKGNGPDIDNKGHHGKIIKCEDMLTEVQATPVWRLTCATQEKRSDGKKVDVSINYWKSYEALDFLYVVLELAGADISSIPPREQDEDEHDKKINICMNHLEDINARFRFSCGHKERKPVPGKRTPKMNVNYYPTSFNLIDGRLPLEGVLPPVDVDAYEEQIADEAVDNVQYEEVEEEEEIIEEHYAKPAPIQKKKIPKNTIKKPKKTAPSAPVDTAFNDDDDDD